MRKNALENTPEEVARAIKAKDIVEELFNTMLDGANLLSAEEIFSILSDLFTLTRSYFGYSHWNRSQTNPEIEATGQVAPYKEHTMIISKGQGSSLLGLSRKDVADLTVEEYTNVDGGRPESKKKNIPRTLCPPNPKIQGFFEMLLVLIHHLKSVYLAEPHEFNLEQGFRIVLSSLVGRGLLDPRRLFTGNLVALFDKQTSSNIQSELNDRAARRRIWQKNADQKARLKALHRSQKKSASTGSRDRKQTSKSS